MDDRNNIHPKLESLQSLLTLKLLKLQTNMRKIFEPPTTKDIFGAFVSGTKFKNSCMYNFLDRCPFPMCVITDDNVCVSFI